MLLLLKALLLATLLVSVAQLPLMCIVFLDGGMRSILGSDNNQSVLQARTESPTCIY